MIIYKLVKIIHNNSDKSESVNRYLNLFSYWVGGSYDKKFGYYSTLFHHFIDDIIKNNFLNEKS